LHNLILASSSPRRQDLLKKIGITKFSVEPPEIDETPLKNEKPSNLVKRLAQEKAKAIYSTHAGNFIVAADTIVVCSHKILQKPQNKQEATKQIESLSGKNHQVFTAVAVISPIGKTVVKLVKTKIKLKKLSQEEITNYIDLNDWQGRCGSYSIEGEFEKFVLEFQGSYSSVIGLPTNKVYQVLTGLGYKNS
jgi:septum formation protein